jgi:alpha-mannosidase
MFGTYKYHIERAEKFLHPTYWSDINLHSALFVEDRALTTTIEVHEPAGSARPPAAAVVREGDWKLATCGQRFGPSWSTKWFRVTCTVPPDAAGGAAAGTTGTQLAFRWDSESEAMLYAADSRNTPLQAFTGGGGHDRRDLYMLTDDDHARADIAVADGHRTYTFYVEMACNGMFGNGGGGMIQAPDPQRTFTLHSCGLVRVNPLGQALFWDMTVLHDLAKSLPEGSALGAAALEATGNIINAVDLKCASSLRAARAVAASVLGRAVDTVPNGGRPSSGSHSDDRVGPLVTALGHCHIDTAWLWPYAETRRKVMRSWATQLGLLKIYPHWSFVASQSCHWEWLREDHPTLFEQALRERRFVEVGGSYVEFDANMPSGESMVRQFLYWRLFFDHHRGHTHTHRAASGEPDCRTRVFWLPDTFGYSAHLPQICRGFGLPYFLSQKLSWNLFNKFPLTTFTWEGIDGSTVLAHFPPADSYGAQGTVEELLKCEANHKSLTTSRRSLLLFGHGDGGGGPAVSHLERLARLESCAAATTGLPRLTTAAARVSDFFEAVETTDYQRVSSLATLRPPTPASTSGTSGTSSTADAAEARRRRVCEPRWVGELYLDLHQGTLTSQAKIKVRGTTTPPLLMMTTQRPGDLISPHPPYPSLSRAPIRRSRTGAARRCCASWKPSSSPPPSPSTPPGPRWPPRPAGGTKGPSGACGKTCC